jgi:1,5-anhydro-D-fructose reductase (1,5-anhydro-D-mannitol-forming)
MINIASVGFWHLHGADYAGEALRHPEVDLVAGWDPDPERLRAAGERSGLRTVDDLDTLLADSSVDGVIVCTATADHREIVTRCLTAGKHVFVEKVLAAELTDAEAIAAAARASGLALTVSMRRSDDDYTAKIAELIGDGAVGQITSARVRDGHPFALPRPGRPDGMLPAQFWDPDQAQGGVLIDLCHPVYLLAAFLGRPDRVSAVLGHVTGRELEDNATAVLSFPDGAVGIAETSSVSAITPFTIEIHGTEGSILYTEPGIGAFVLARQELPESGADSRNEGAPGPDDRPRLRVRSTSPGSAWRDIEVRSDRPTAFDSWVRHVIDGTRDDSNLELALQLTAVVEAAYASDSAGRVVDLRPPGQLRETGRP